MSSPTKCLLLCPKFGGQSFWDYRRTCEILNAKYPAAPLGIITVAAMLPEDWELRLTDRNVDAMEDSDLDWADIIMMTGMLPQQTDSLHIIAEAKNRGIPSSTART